MIGSRLFVLLGLILLAVPLLLRAQNPVSVPLDDPVYAYLERMEALGYVDNLLDGIRPYSREKVAEYLQRLVRKRHRLTKIDQDRLDNLLLDYRFEINRQEKNAFVPEGQDWYSILAGYRNFKNDFVRFFKQNHPEEENHVLLWEKGGDNFYVDYDQDVTYERRSDGVYRIANWQTYYFRGLFDHRFAYRWNVSLHSVRGDDAYAVQHPILKGSWSQKVGEDQPRYSDRTGGELIWNTGYVDLQFAQQEIKWGVGESGNLILSDYPEPYPYISIAKEWDRIKFMALHGKLQSFPDDTLDNGLRLYPDKWLAAHRLEISIARTVTLGFNETFIYGRRYVDWAYLMPFNFYRAVEHKLRDRDNATISIDAEWLIMPGTKLYGTVFFDEFRSSELFSDWFGNKHAAQIGLMQVDPFGLHNLSLRLEYVAVLPWVYTHKFRVNSYTTDFRSLGYWAGPNSEVYYIHLLKDWHWRFRTGLKWRQWKHGENFTDKDIGGDILEGHETGDPIYRKFLGGRLTTERRLELYSRYEVFNGFFFRARYNWLNIKRPQADESLNELFLGLELRY